MCGAISLAIPPHAVISPAFVAGGLPRCCTMFRWHCTAKAQPHASDTEGDDKLDHAAKPSRWRRLGVVASALWLLCSAWLGYSHYMRVQNLIKYEFPQQGGALGEWCDEQARAMLGNDDLKKGYEQCNKLRETESWDQARGRVIGNSFMEFAIFFFGGLIVIWGGGFVAQRTYRWVRG